MGKMEDAGIVLFTDFGMASPYVGQMRLVLAKLTHCRVLDLLHEAPRFDPKAAAHLLRALVRVLPGDWIFVAVVDPGVGGSRRPILVRSDLGWFVGPDNGLLSRVIRSAGGVEVTEILWRPEHLSETFHGRDLFAPVAARLANGGDVEGRPLDPEDTVGYAWPDILEEVIYVDPFGNLFTGIPATEISEDAVLFIGSRRIPYARAFCEVEEGAPFWYRNSCALVEVAVNRGRADRLLGAGIGTAVGRS